MYVFGLIEMYDYSSGGGTLDECPWAPRLLSLLLDGWLSLGSVSGTGPFSGPIFMTVNQAPPPMLFSPPH